MGAHDYMNSYFSTGDWVIILLYVLGIIALGLWFGKDQHNTRDYFLGSKNVPWWGIGLSIVAAETSALTIIGVPAMALHPGPATNGAADSTRSPRPR